MRFEDIYKMALRGMLEEQVMKDFFNENPKELRRNNRFFDIYKLLLCFMNSKRTDLMETLLELLKSNMIFYNIFVFMFDENARTTKMFDKIVGKNYALSVEGFNILFDVLFSFKNDRDCYCNMFYDYYQAIANRDSGGRFKDIRFEYLNALEMSELFYSFRDTFVKELRNYLAKHKGIKVYFGNYSNSLYDSFKEYDKRIFCGDLLLNDIKYLDEVLKNSCNCKRGFSFDTNIYKIIWDYYVRTKDSNISVRTIHFIRDNLDRCLTIDYRTEGCEEIVVPKSSIRFMNDIVKSGVESNERVKFVIDYETANSCYDDLLEIENKERVLIDFRGIGDDGKISLKDYIRSHLFYDATADLINRFDFSPLERYIYAYYLTTILKKYRYYKDDRKLDSMYGNMSRNLYYIIYGDYIVCAGYVNYIVNLLKKVGLNSSFLLVSPPEVSECHARVLTHIVDEKYGIDGVYIGDPTQDAGDEMSFAWALMTKDKDSYDKYQKDDDSAFDFYLAMASLDLMDEQCDARNKEFYNIINKPISNMVKVEAIKRVLEAIHPDFSEEEIDFRMKNIAMRSNFVYLSDEMLGTRCRDIKSLRILNEVLENDFVQLKWVVSNFDNINWSEIFFTVNIDGVSNQELQNKLMIYLDRDSTFVYSEDYQNPLIKVKFDLDCTVRDVLDGMKRITNSLEKGFKNSVGNESKRNGIMISSLYDLFLNNNRIASALLNTGTSSKEQNIIDLYINEEITLDEIVSLFRLRAIKRSSFMALCEKENVSFNSFVLEQAKSPSK